MNTSEKIVEVLKNNTLLTTENTTLTNTVDLLTNQVKKLEEEVDSTRIKFTSIVDHLEAAYTASLAEQQKSFGDALHTAQDAYTVNTQRILDSNTTLSDALKQMTGNYNALLNKFNNWVKDQIKIGAAC